MNRTMLSRMFCLSLMAATAAPVWAQSLADVSRKEEERRKTIKEPAKVYTNKDLGSAPAPTAEPQTGDKADQAKQKQGDESAAADDKSKDKDEKSKDKSATDQQYWFNRMKTLQTQLEHDQDFAEALQTRINSLAADFVNHDDPAQRAVIGANRDKSLAELDRLKLAIQSDKKAIVDLEEEARRTGIPPGWLR